MAWFAAMSVAVISEYVKSNELLTTSPPKRVSVAT
jgi:hypothetical protein